MASRDREFGDGATGWLNLGCRVQNDGLGQYAKTPVAPDPLYSQMMQNGPWLKDTLPRFPRKRITMARHTSLPG